MHLHQGEIVELAVRRSAVNISEISRKMKVNRRSIYNWFRRHSLKIEIICEIGYIINHDFSQEFPDQFVEGGFAIAQGFVEENKELTGRLNSAHFWMNKYIVLLEKYNALLSGESLDSENLTIVNYS